MIKCSPTVSCGGLSITFVYLLNYVLAGLHICIGSDVVITIVLTQTFYNFPVFGFTK